MEEFLDDSEKVWAKAKHTFKPDVHIGNQTSHIVAALILEVAQLRKELERLNSIIDKG